MSWDPTCEAIAKANPCISDILISGIDGNAYGTSNRSKLWIGPQEMKDIIGAVNGTSTASSFLVNNTRYMLIKNVGNQIIAKKEKQSLIAGTTPKLCLVALVDESDGNKVGTALQSLYKLQEHYTANF